MIEPRPVAAGPLRTIPVFYRMLLRGQLTRGRLVGLGVLGLFAVVLAVVFRTESVEVQVEAVAEYAIALLLPLSALLLATPMIGNLVEDRLLVYLWLKPIPRWHLAVAALGAVVSVLVPAVVLPVVVMIVIMGAFDLFVVTVLAVSLGCVAYGALYLFFGARFSWGLWLGLVHLVLFEQIISRWSTGTAQLSIRSYLNTILSWGTDVRVPLEGRGDVAAVLVPLLIALAAAALTARTLTRRDID